MDESLGERALIRRLAAHISLHGLNHDICVSICKIALCISLGLRQHTQNIILVSGVILAPQNLAWLRAITLRLQSNGYRTQDLVGNVATGGPQSALLPMVPLDEKRHVTTLFLRAQDKRALHAGRPLLDVLDRHGELKLERAHGSKEQCLHPTRQRGSVSRRRNSGTR